MATLEEVEALVAQAGAGDRAALARLYALSAPRVFALCLRMLDDPEAAESALVETYVAVWNGEAGSGPAERGGMEALTWLLVRARAEAVARKRARGAEAATALRQGGSRPEDADGDAWGTFGAPRPRLSDCLDSLPRKRAAALRAAYLDAEDYAGLAARFNVPVSTMRTWLRDSLGALRGCLSR